MLVTGGAGFIGSRLVRFLLEEGHAVTVFDNLSGGSFDRIPEEACCIEGDIEDEGAVTALFSEHTFDAVFHEVRQLPDSQDLTEDDLRKSLAGLVNVLEQCCRQGVKKFVFASSAAVYGEAARVPSREDDERNPVTADGQLKAAAEDCIRQYYEHQGLPYVILRYANVYGQGQDLGGSVVTRFAHAVVCGGDLTICGDGNQSRDFIHVDDVVRANLAAVADGIAPGIYNIGTQSETTINALKEIFLYYARAGVSVSYDDTRDGGVYRSALHNGKAEEMLNWHPKIRFMSGLMAMYQYFCEREDAQ